MSQELKPDFTHTGHVAYTINFYGNRADIEILGQQNYYDKIAIHHIVKEDMNVVAEELRKNKSKVHKHFIKLDRTRAISARYIIEKFIDRCMGVVLFQHQNGVTAEEQNSEELVHEESEENPSAPEVIKERSDDIVKHQEGEL